MKARLRWLCCLLALTACATARPRLYEQLGGEPGVERLVDAMISEVKGDPRFGELFAETDFAYFRERLIEQTCQLADGPCTYTGLPMDEAHSGMAISEREFTWFVEDVEIAMDRVEVPLPVQNRLLARLAKMRADVIHQ